MISTAQDVREPEDQIVKNFCYHTVAWKAETEQTDLWVE